MTSMTNRTWPSASARRWCEGAAVSSPCVRRADWTSAWWPTTVSTNDRSPRSGPTVTAASSTNCASTSHRVPLTLSARSGPSSLAGPCTKAHAKNSRTSPAPRASLFDCSSSASRIRPRLARARTPTSRATTWEARSFATKPWAPRSCGCSRTGRRCETPRGLSTASLAVAPTPERSMRLTESRSDTHSVGVTTGDFGHLLLARRDEGHHRA